ncbi:MAG: hypothetical protein HYT43_00975 [Candidatus Taylorbacteria bacterium]|nr:hypothetical protein [Candidatus Taylorbacteria bacterium]
MRDEDESGLEKLQRGLYAREEPERKEADDLELDPQAVREVWTDAEVPPPRAKIPVMKTIFIFSVIFFLIALGMAAFVFFKGDNVVSSENVDLEVTGPVNLRGGDELRLAVSIRNRNNARLTKGSLNITFPEGAKEPDDVSQELSFVSVPVRDLSPGGREESEVRAVIFGAENESKKFKMVFEYRVAGSNALFSKEAEYEIILSSAPLTLRIDALREISSGQEYEMVINIVSNAASPLESIAVRVDYPFGFRFGSALPLPTFGDNVWILETLSPREQRSFRIKGVMSGREGEERAFKVSLGSRSSLNERDIGSVFISAVHKTAVRSPFISAALFIDGDDSTKDYVSRSGKTIRVDVNWQNNLPVSVRDLAVEARLSGNALDKRSVTVENGFYDSAGDVVIWNKEHKSDFGDVSAGAKGVLSFIFNPLSWSANQNLRNPEVSVSLSVKGKRAEAAVPEELFQTVSRKIKIATDLTLGSRAVYSVGPFVGRGPLPPKAERETTYTIIWTVTNTANLVSNVEAIASLPSYVKWLGKSSPSGERINFDQSSNKVTWELGDVRSGAGWATAAKQVSFQILLTPSESQIGTAPVLVSGMSISALDRFTGTEIRSGESQLTTRISTDPIFNVGMELVVK